MNAFTRFILVQGKYVVAIWALLLALGAGFALRLPDVIHGSSDAIRDSSSGYVTDAIHEKFGRGAAYLFPVIVQGGDADIDDPHFRAQVGEIERSLEAVSEPGAVKHYWNTGARELLGRDGRSALLLVQPGVATFYEAEDATRTLRAALGGAEIAPGFSATVTGMPALFHDLNRNSSADLLRAERIGIPATLLILLIVFGAPVAAVLPLLLAVASVTLSSAGLYLLSDWLPVSVFAQNAVAMIGLGIGVDYALFMVTRFRDYLAQGQSAQEAVISASASVGPALLVSGTAVGVGFLALLLVKAQFLHSIALGGLLVVLSTLAATLTLLPVLLQLLARWISRPERLLPASRFESNFRGLWNRWTSRVMRRPWVHLVAAFAVLAVFIVPVFRMIPRNVSADDLPLQFEARRGFELLKKNFQAGWMGPVVLLAEAGPRATLWDKAAQRSLLAIAARLEEDDQVAAVNGFPRLLRALGDGRHAVQSRGQIPGALAGVAAEAISGDGASALLIVVPRYAPDSREAFRYVRQLRKDAWPEASDAGITIRIGGPTAMVSDFDAELLGSLWRVIPAVLAVTFLVLSWSFRSLLIPLKAILLNLMSVLAAYGFLVLLFQDGLGASMIGIDPPGGLNSMIVLMLFTILFGLSMDYEVFLLRQVQEEWQRSGDNRGSVASGVGRSAGAITSAALIMVCLFVSFGFTQLVATREFGLGLAFAVALDATLIRLVIVPASMELLGEANWWCPAWSRPSVSSRPALP